MSSTRDTQGKTNKEFVCELHESSARTGLNIQRSGLQTASYLLVLKACNQWSLSHHLPICAIEEVCKPHLNHKKRWILELILVRVNWYWDRLLRGINCARCDVWHWRFVWFFFFSVEIMDASTTAVMSAFSIVLGQQEGDRRLAEQNLIALEVLDCEWISLFIKSSMCQFFFSITQSNSP